MARNHECDFVPGQRMRDNRAVAPLARGNERETRNAVAESTGRQAISRPVELPMEYIFQK